MTADEARAAARLRPLQVLAVVVIGLVVRVGYEAALRADDGPAGLLATHVLGDERAYDAFARAGAEGTLDRERAFYQEPLYAWLLGRVYAVWPPTPVAEDAAAIPREGVREGVVWAQHLLGVLVALGTARLAARVGGRNAGLVAGLLMAVSGPAVLHEAMLLKATLSLAVLLLCLELWLDVLEGAGEVRAAGLGLALGVAVLLRGNLYLLLALVLGSLLLRRSGRRPLAAALVLLGAALAISPVTVHNLRRGDLVLTTYQAGTNIAIGQPPGDDPAAGVGYAPLRAGRGDARFEEQDAVELAEAGAGRALGSREVSAWWLARALERVTANPGVALRRVGWKLLHLVHGIEVPDVKDWAFLRRAVPWLATPLSDLRVLGAWALLAFVLLPWRGRQDLFVVRSAVVVVAVSLALVYVMGRYRLTAVPPMLVLAACGMVRGWAFLRAPGHAARKAGLVAAAVGLPWALALVPVPTDPNGDHVSLLNASSVALFHARTSTDAGAAVAWRDRALALAEEAAAVAPAFDDARAGVVRAAEARTPVLDPLPDRARDGAWRLVLLLLGKRTGADVLAPLAADEASAARAAVALLDRPPRPGGDAFTGPLLADALRMLVPHLRPDTDVPGLDDGAVLPVALACTDLALALEPEHPVTLAQRGVVLGRLDRPLDAERAYRAALAAGGETPEVLNNLGNLLLRQGRAADAATCFERALELAPGHPTIRVNLERAERARASGDGGEPRDT